MPSLRSIVALLFLTAGPVGWVVCESPAQQPPAHQQPAVGQQPVAPQQPTAPFQLNQLQQAFLDQVLDAWERKSGEIITFNCEFERWEYNDVWGPKSTGQDIPLSKDRGTLKYQKPDKGSFQITEIRRWKADKVPPDGKIPAEPTGQWIHDPQAIGEHFVCDGKAVYEYRHEQKQVVVRPIPPEMQGKAIVDGPLPFLFGAEADKLKRRYWMRIQDQDNPDEIWLEARPKFQVDAAEYRSVELILDRVQLLPKAMQVYRPDGSRHVYIFDLAGATVNSPLEKIKSLFPPLMVPPGWKRVVEELPEEGPPVQYLDRQAEQPGGLPQQR